MDWTDIDHVHRIRRVFDAIGSAKELIESIAKVVLMDCGRPQMLRAWGHGCVSFAQTGTAVGDLHGNMRGRGGSRSTLILASSEKRVA